MAMPRRHEHMAATWCAAYRAGNSVWKIGRQHGVGGQTVWNYLKMYGVPRRAGEQAVRKEPIQAQVFDDPNAPEAAYWLGLIYADGSMALSKTGHYTLSLTAHGDDTESVQGLLNFVGMRGHVGRYKNRNACYTSITSIALCRKLRTLGVVPNKTHTIKFP